MKRLKNFLLITMVLVFSAALFSCGAGPSDNNTEKPDNPDVSETYVVIFYSDDGITVLDEQEVVKGEEFTLPEDTEKRNILGYYKWEGNKWGVELITVTEFDEPDAKKVFCDLKFKVKYEWTPVSR